MAIDPATRGLGKPMKPGECKENCIRRFSKLGKWTECFKASMVLMSLMHDITRYFSDEVTVLAVWVQSEESACVVYTRSIEPSVRLGRRLGFPPHAREDDPASTNQASRSFFANPLLSTPMSRIMTGNTCTGSECETNPVSRTIYRT